MIHILTAEQPEAWFLCFHRSCASPIWQLLIPGHWKHVRAFTYAAAPRVWLFYDVSLTQTRIVVAPEGQEADRMVGEYIDGAAVLRMRVGTERKPSLRSRVGFWCVPAMRHLLGLPGGALLPERLWRDCLSNGAELIVYEREHPSPTAGPGARSAARGGAAQCDAASTAIPRPADSGYVEPVRERNAA